MTTTNDTSSTPGTARAFEEVPSFNIDKFISASRPLDLSGIRLEDAANFPLSPSEVRVMRYMQDTEFYTVHYMKALMETHALADNEARAFMVCWGYEECFHGRALARLVEVCGHEPSRRSIEEFARPRKSTEVVQDFGGRLLSFLSKDFLATHMTWGAINELTAIHAYSRLAELSANPIVDAVMRRIVKDERRHFAFYYQQGKRRLQHSALAQRMASLSLKALWEPVGGSMAPARGPRLRGRVPLRRRGRPGAPRGDRRHHREAAGHGVVQPGVEAHQRGHAPHDGLRGPDAPPRAPLGRRRRVARSPLILI
ncbi:MAG: hypothetical protein IPF99_30485 [Deltaproteobacteria bacterium]|nr:hypothetical protein [Deltaproteobacteria bacterium]